MLENLNAALANPKALNPGPACRYCPYTHACPASAAPGRYVLDTCTGKMIEMAARSLTAR